MSRPVCEIPGGEPLGDAPSPTPEAIRGAAARCLASYACTYCEICQLLCPDLCITRDPDTGWILIDLDHCKGCGLCAHFCPKGAIEMEMERGAEG